MIESTRGGSAEYSWELGDGVEPGPPRGPAERHQLQIGGYELVGEIARGGVGAVYRARHPALGREVAIKILLAGKGANQLQRQRFATEATAVARLRHPNIVSVHDVGEEEGCPYLVMDFIRGGSLQDQLTADDRPDARRTAALFAQLADALEAAHQAGVLHRDLKPGNVLVDERGQPLLTDFGLAKVVDADAAGPTQDGQVMGTPSYMAPEQAGGESVDARTDVYGLGATLFAVLCGEPPFVGRSALEVMAAVVATEPVLPSSLHPGLDRDLDTICLTCLEKEPSRRYQSARDLAEDLGRYLRHEPILARPPGPVDRFQKWTRRNRTASRVLAGATALLLATAGGAAIWVARAEAARAKEAAARARETADRAYEAAVLEREARAHREKIEDLLDEAERGALDTRVDGLLDVVFEIVKQAGPGTPRQLADRLESIAVDLERVEAELAAQAEIRAGEPPIPGLSAAMAERARTPINEELSLGAKQALRVYRRRVGARRSGVYGSALAARQARQIDPGRMAVARVACAALGRLESDPRSVVALGRYLRAVANPVQAVRAAQALVRLNDARAMRYVHEARRAFGVASTFNEQISRTLESMTSLPAVEEPTGEDPQAWLVRGEELGVRGDSAGAQAAYERALELDPELASAWINLGNARRHQGDNQGALLAYARALELDDRNPITWNNRGSALQSLGAFRQALGSYGRAIELGPAYTVAWLNRGNVRLTLGDLQGAVSDLAHAAELEPGNPLSWESLGAALRESGDLQRALAAHSRAIELDPQLAMAWANRALARQLCGDEAGALADVEQALAIEPRFALAWATRGYLFFLRGELQSAEFDFSKAIDLDPRGQLETRVNRGTIYMRLDRGDEAVADFEYVVRFEPEHAGAWSNLGTAYVLVGRIGDGVEALRRSVQLNPSDSRAIGNYGMALCRLERWADADAALSRALELDAGLDVLWYHRGLTRARLQQTESARADLTRFLELSPHHANAPRAREILQGLQGQAQADVPE